MVSFGFGEIIMLRLSGKGSGMPSPMQCKLLTMSAMLNSCCLDSVLFYRFHRHLSVHQHDRQ
jgi:hypothetical protein